MSNAAETLEINQLRARVKELEQAIAGEPLSFDRRLSYVEIQIDPELWIACCLRHCPAASWFKEAIKNG